MDSDLLADIVDLETGEKLNALCELGRLDRTPVEVVLFLYVRGPHDVLYSNYYEGFKLLVDWLGPFDTPDLEYKPLPAWLNNWECNEIASILKTTPELIFHFFLEYYQAD